MNDSKVYKERFINATTNYERYLILKDALAWAEHLYELNEHKTAEIAGLRKSIQGYDLNEYT